MDILSDIRSQYCSHIKSLEAQTIPGRGAVTSQKLTSPSKISEVRFDTYLLAVFYHFIIVKKFK